MGNDIDTDRCLEALDTVTPDEWHLALARDSGGTYLVLYSIEHRCDYILEPEVGGVWYHDDTHYPTVGDAVAALTKG